MIWTWISGAIVVLFLAIGIRGIWEQIHGKPFKRNVRETYYNAEDDTKP